MESTIQKLFDRKNRSFEIPSYQRSYSWDEEQINQFIDDLTEVNYNYYLGHFLFEMKDDHTLYVIDGQQRLTTCIIFFSCVLSELKHRQDKGETININLDDIIDYYLKDIRKGTEKFVTTKEDNNFFHNVILENKPQKTISTSSQQKIKTALEFFKKHLSSLSTGEIERQFSLVEGAAITEYVVIDKIRAAQIFSFQNDRGKRLSNLEIIKSHFMLQIYLNGNKPEKIIQDITFLENEFSTIYYQILKISLNEDEVLNYFWRAKSKKGYSDDVIKGTKNALKEAKDKTEWIKDFISGLSHSFQFVKKIEEGNFSYTKDLFN